MNTAYIVKCKDCGNEIRLGDSALELYSILYYDDRKEYMCGECCRIYAEINDAKGG